MLELFNWAYLVVRVSSVFCHLIEILQQQKKLLLIPTYSNSHTQSPSLFLFPLLLYLSISVAIFLLHDTTTTISVFVDVGRRKEKLLSRAADDIPSKKYRCVMVVIAVVCIESVN